MMRTGSVRCTRIDGLQLNAGKDTWCSEYESTVMFLSLTLDGRSKEALITAPVLVRPVSGKEVVMYGDASYVGLG
ncbi:hypothetical protein V6N11_044458 [Hibiscus sabdariffa]|uniref:Uncharacterized protein n=1 Tax=Hibiscus sabdariffa TaxID=183260 RepID=A0ABR2RFE8_9ROSI